MRRNLLSSGAWTVVDGTVGILTSSVALLVISRVVGPEEFGLGIAIVSSIQIGLLLTETLFQDALIADRSQSQVTENAAWWISMGLAGTLLLVVAQTAPVINGAFSDGRAGMLFFVGSLVLPLAAATSVPVARLNRQMQFRSLALRTLVSRTAGAAAGIGMSFAGLGAWALIGQLGLTYLIGTVFAFRLEAWRPSAPTLATLANRGSRSAYRTSLILLINELLSYGLPRLLTVGLALAVGSREAAIYGLASRVIDNVKDVIGHASYRVVIANVSRQALDAPSRNQSILDATAVASRLATPVFLAAFFVTSRAVEETLGEAWRHVAQIVPVLSLAALLQVQRSPLNAGFVAFGRAGTNLLLSLTGTVVLAGVIVVSALLSARVTADTFAFAQLGRGLAVSLLSIILAKSTFGIAAGKGAAELVRLIIFITGIVAVRATAEALFGSEAGIQIVLCEAMALLALTFGLSARHLKIRLLP